MENDNIEMGIQADIQVNDKGLDAFNTKLEKAADTATKVEKVTSSALKGISAGFDELSKDVERNLDLFDKLAKKTKPLEEAYHRLFTTNRYDESGASQQLSRKERAGLEDFSNRHFEEIVNNRLNKFFASFENGSGYKLAEIYANKQMARAFGEATGMYAGKGFVMTTPSNQEWSRPNADYERQRLTAEQMMRGKQTPLLITQDAGRASEFVSKLKEESKKAEEASNIYTQTINTIGSFINYYSQKAKQAESSMRDMSRSSSLSAKETWYKQQSEARRERWESQPLSPDEAYRLLYQTNAGFTPDKIFPRVDINGPESLSPDDAYRLFYDMLKQQEAEQQAQLKEQQAQLKIQEEIRKKSGEFLKWLGETTVNEEQIAADVKENKEYYEKVKERFKANKNGQFFEWEKDNYATQQSQPLLITADAGIAKEKAEQLSAEQKITEAEEQEAQAAQESVDKKKKMTEYQQEKIRIADQQQKIEKEELSLSQQRINEWKRENDRKEADRNSPAAQFKNAHPELFALRGGQDWSGKYQAARAFANIGTSVGRLGPAGKAIGGILDSIGAFVRSPIAGAAVAITKLTTGVVDLAQASIKAYSEIESIKTQLGVVFSNQTQADAMFGQISQYAVKSPFGVQQTSELAILLKQSGVYATDLMKTLRMLGDTAGGNMEKMKRIANNYAQIVSIGKASMLDMRQFAYAGIPIFEAVSKELKVSQQELRKMISEGKVTSDIIEKVFKDLTGINGIFENATEKGAKTLKARLQNLKDAQQLALGSVGEWLTSVNSSGNPYNQDTVANKIVSGLENIYNWLRENVSLKNAEKDEQEIEALKKQIEAVKQLIEDEEDAGTRELFKNRLKELEKLYDIEKAMATYVTSYDLKNQGHNEDMQALGVKNYSSETALKKLLAFDKKYERYVEAASVIMNSFLDDEDKMAIYSARRKYREEHPGATEEEANEYIKAIGEERKRLVEILNNARLAETTNAAEQDANRKRNLVQAQQSEYDRNQKAIGAADSYTTGFEKLYSLATQSEEYKKQKQQEEIAFLKEAKEALIALKEFVDNEGNLDMTRMSYKDFSSMYNEKNAFDINRKLTIIEGKSQQQMTEDRILLFSQWKDMSEKIAEELKVDNRDKIFRQKSGNYEKMLGLAPSNEKWYEYFDGFIEAQLEYLKEGENAARSPEVKKRYQEYQKNLLASTFVLGLNTGGINGNPEDLLKSKTEFIPLWKRILASHTGLSTLEMTDSTSTMDRYRNDMAVRNMANNVMTATMQSIGVDAAMRLISAGGAKQLKEDSRPTIQVDWKQTRENIKSFSLALSASTSVISAYKKSLEDELNTYQQVIIAGYTQGEDQNGGESQFISVKKLAQYAQSNEQLVNAFGDVIETESGKKYSIDEVMFKNGEILDKFGNKIDEQVKVTSNVSRYIERILPEIARDIHEATVMEVKNNTLNQMLGDVIGTKFASSILGSVSGKAANFAVNNQSQVSTLATSAINTLKMSSPEIRGLSPEDILMFATRAQTGELDRLIKEAETLDVNSKEFERSAELIVRLDKSLEVYNKALDLTGQYITDLTNDEGYGVLHSLGRTKNRDEALNTLFLKMRGSYEADQLSPSAWKDEGGYSLKSKIVNDLLGYSRDFTKEDYYEGFKEKYGISTELETATKRFLDFKLALEDTKDIMKGLGDETANLVGTLGKKALTIPFEKLGESALNYWSQALSYEEASEKCAEDQKQAYRELGTEALQALGPIMQKAGFEMVARGAINDSLGMILGGLGLAAAGGFASGLGNALSANNDKNKDEAEKIQDLKDQLADLLEQARKDALYYENNLRHKTALGINKEFSYQSVHDAVITPEGDVITTDPKDYLIATKTPGQFAGGGTVTPIINNNIINNSSSKVRQEQQQNPDGSIDIITIIEDTVGNYIASSKSDDAFSARNSRIRGRQSIMS